MIEILASLFPAAVLAGTPLLLGALGEILTERAGNLNLGVEGMMFMGAISGLAGSYFYEQAVLSSGGTPNGVLSAIIAMITSMLCRYAGGADLQLPHHFAACQPECHRSDPDHLRHRVRQLLRRIHRPEGRRLCGRVFGDQGGLFRSPDPGPLGASSGGSAAVQLQLAGLPGYSAGGVPVLVPDPVPGGAQPPGSGRRPGHCRCRGHQCHPL